MSEYQATSHESDMLLQDALDRFRTEVALEMRKHARRAKQDSVGWIKAQFALNPLASPERVAIEAMQDWKSKAYAIEVKGAQAPSDS